KLIAPSSGIVPSSAAVAGSSQGELVQTECSSGTAATSFPGFRLPACRLLQLKRAPVRTGVVKLLPETRSASSTEACAVAVVSGSVGVRAVGAVSSAAQATPSGPTWAARTKR